MALRDKDKRAGSREPPKGADSTRKKPKINMACFIALLQKTYLPEQAELPPHLNKHILYGSQGAFTATGCSPALLGFLLTATLKTVMQLSPCSL